MIVMSSSAVVDNSDIRDLCARLPRFQQLSDEEYVEQLNLKRILVMKNIKCELCGIFIYKGLYCDYCLDLYREGIKLIELNKTLMSTWRSW
jgi:hypothetical protein